MNSPMANIFVGYIVSSIESLILIVSLLAAFGGGIILLSCLATQRSQLLKALEMELEIEAREEMIREKAIKEREKKRKIQDDVLTAEGLT